MVRKKNMWSLRKWFVNLCTSAASHQRNGTHLDEEVRLLQLPVLQLIWLIGVIHGTHQLIYLQEVILSWGGNKTVKKHKYLNFFKGNPEFASARTEVRQHGCFQVVSTGGRREVKLQESFQALLLVRSLHGGAQADGDGWHHGTQSLNKQHCHHFIRVFEHLQRFQTQGYSYFSTHKWDDTLGRVSPVCTTGAEHATSRAGFHKTLTAADSDWARSERDPAKCSPTDPKEVKERGQIKYRNWRFWNKSLKWRLLSTLWHL